MNTQFAIKDDTIYVLEVNPRASRTVPYLSKATGVPLAKIAARVMVGKTLAQLGLTEISRSPACSSRRRSFRSCGSRASTPSWPGDEVDRRSDGRRDTFGAAFAKAQLAAGVSCRRRARVHQRQQPRQAGRRADRPRPAGARLQLVATRGTANYLRAHGIDAEIVFKVNEGRPHVGDEIVNRHDPAGDQHAARTGVVLRRQVRAPDAR